MKQKLRHSVWIPLEYIQTYQKYKKHQETLSRFVLNAIDTLVIERSKNIETPLPETFSKKEEVLHRGTSSENVKERGGAI